MPTKTEEKPATDKLTAARNKNLDLAIQMKLRHDFAGHYNRPDIFQMHINRAAPQLYRVHNDPAALTAPATEELPVPPPRLEPPVDE